MESQLAQLRIVSVVIPVFNRWELTQVCLDSVLKHSVNLKELWVVDNGSTDATPVELQRYAQKFLALGIGFEVIKNAENLGFGRACNQGLRKMTGEYLVVLNNDTWLMPGWDQALVEQCRRTAADCVGPYFYEKPFVSEAHVLTQASRFIKRNRLAIRKQFVPILMMFTRGAYERLKIKGRSGEVDSLFDERFFVTSEDRDLRERMVRAGMVFLQTGACFIWHRSMGTRAAGKKGGGLSLPSTYEQEGLRLFQEKWGFDPVPLDHTPLAKFKRRWWRLKERFGFL